MTVEQLQQFILETYGVNANYPWAKYPDYKVFRHSSNQKWFALVMNISKEKIGLPQKDMINVMNVKCDPIIMDSIKKENGIYTAYHMSKAHWITVALDGSVEEEKIKWLLNMSYHLTEKKKK